MKEINLIFLIATMLFSCQRNKPLWNRDALQKAVEYGLEIGSFAIVVQTEGEIMASLGDIGKSSRIHSVRKAILSAMVFQHLDKIDLEATLADLEIQDSPIPLTALQQTAKVIHLLKSTSGINHPTGSQVGSMQADRDALLGSEPNVPGSKWAYNNWDYNVLTTILEQETGQSASELFQQGIGHPLSMHDFEVFYRSDTSLSQHAKAGFRLSTRDMAKFGQLFLNKGSWNGQQLIPQEWIEKVTTDFTPTIKQSTERAGHGYLWWIPDASYAQGLLPGGK